MIYVLQCSATGRIKIGKTNDLATRLVAHRAASPTELLLLGTIEDDVTTESDLHSRCSPDRIRGKCGREWFYNGPSTQRVLREYKLTTPSVVVPDAFGVPGGQPFVQPTKRVCSDCGGRFDPEEMSADSPRRVRPLPGYERFFDPCLRCEGAQNAEFEKWYAAELAHLTAEEEAGRGHRWDGKDWVPVAEFEARRAEETMWPS